MKKPNLILMMDSYKLPHQNCSLYPGETTIVSSYGEARTTGEEIVFFGLQAFVKQYLQDPITTADVDEAEMIANLHGVSFNRSVWDRVVKEYDGFIPVQIWALPEGMVVPSSTPLYVVDSFEDREMAFLAASIETFIQRAVWYPTSIASRDRKLYKALVEIYNQSSDNPNMIPFHFHDFGARGVSSQESACIGGGAHLIYFQGTDTLSSLLWVRENYAWTDPSFMPGYSVNATEHSIQCAYGPTKENQRNYITTMIKQLGKKDRIISVVMDGFDFFRELDTLCEPETIKLIREIGCKFVVRPDSGEPDVIIPITLERLADAFGYEINSKGKKVLKDVGVIWGDGINHTTAVTYTQLVVDLGYAPENVIYGSGGGLLQKVDRDTFKIAQKTSAMLTDGKWVDIVKDPITDPGKRSKGGRQVITPMVPIYTPHNTFTNYSTFTEVRERAHQ